MYRLKWKPPLEDGQDTKILILEFTEKQKKENKRTTGSLCKIDI